MRSIQIGVILGIFAAVIICSMTAVVVTFIVANEKAIRVSIGTLVDNVMLRNVEVALRYVNFFETAVYQTATAVRTLNVSALQLATENATLGDLSAATAVAWATAIQPMWTVLSFSGFPSAAVLATFELWAPDSKFGSYAPDSVRWDGAGCVPISHNCFLYNSTLNRTVSVPANDDRSVIYVDNATVSQGMPSFLSYTSSFIDNTFMDVHQQPSSAGSWSPMYITPAYAVSSTVCDGVPTLRYLIFFVCFDYKYVTETGFSCVHGVGTMLTAEALDSVNATSLPSHAKSAVHSLKEVDLMGGKCDPDEQATEVFEIYTKACEDDAKKGKLINGTTGTPEDLASNHNFTGGLVNVPSRSVVQYSYCRPRAYLSSDQVTSSCVLETKKGLSFVFIDETPRSFFFGAADRSKKICVVLGCIVIVLTLLMCVFFWLVTTRPIRWICRGMQRAKTLATAEKDTLDHARWYTIIYEVSMLYTAYLELRQALKELKAYVPQGLFVAPSDSSVLRPDAFMANLLGLDGDSTDDGGFGEDSDDDDDEEEDDDDEDGGEEGDVSIGFGDDHDDDQPRLRGTRGKQFFMDVEDHPGEAAVDSDSAPSAASASIYRYEHRPSDARKGAAEMTQEMRELMVDPLSVSDENNNGSTIFSDPEPSRHRRRSRQMVHQHMSGNTPTRQTSGGQMGGTTTTATLTSSANVPLGATDSKGVEAKGIVTIFGTSASQPSEARRRTGPELSTRLDSKTIGHDVSSPGALWSGVPAAEASASVAVAAAYPPTHPHTGGIVTLVPIQSTSAAGSSPRLPPGTRAHDVDRELSGASSTTAQPMRTTAMPHPSIPTAVAAPTTRKRMSTPRTTIIRFANPGTASEKDARPGVTLDTATASLTPRSMDVDPSALQLDLTRTSAVNQFRMTTCSFIFIAFSFRFIDGVNLEKDVSKLMDIIVRCTLRLGGVLEIFRPDLVAISFGAQATQSQHLQRAITCAASISKMSPSKLGARMRVLVDSGAYFVGCCGAHERISRVVFGDRFDFALDLLKHDLLLGRVLLTDRVAVCLPAAAVTPVDYVIPLRRRSQGTQLFQLLDPKKARDKAYRQGARYFRTAFMHALEGHFNEALQVLDNGGLHDPELADYLARAMRFLMASRPVRPRYCRFQLTEFELLGALPRERVPKYQYDRLSLQQINPEQSTPSIQFGFGDSLSNSLDPNGLSRAIFGAGQPNASVSGGSGSPQLRPARHSTAFSAASHQGSLDDGHAEAKMGMLDDHAMLAEVAQGQAPAPSLNTGEKDPSVASRGARGPLSRPPSAQYVDKDNHEFSRERTTDTNANPFGASGAVNINGDDDDPDTLDGLPPLVFTDHDGNTWHRMPQAIGAGAFAEVYMVVSNTGTLMAAKCIRLTSSHVNLEDVVAEVNIACGLFNDFIVNYTGWSHTASYLFLLMEYMPGGTLQKLITGFPTGMPLQLARHYAADALKGLAYLHHHNVIHADFKPQNVLLSVDGGCKISDFGSSLTRGRALQLTGDVFQLRGTPFYMSPEVASGASPSMRSDVWSYGVCVYEVLTGGLPWKLKTLVRRGGAPSESPTTAAGPLAETLTGLPNSTTATVPTAGMARAGLSTPLTMGSDEQPRTYIAGTAMSAGRGMPADMSIANESKFSLNTSLGSVNLVLHGSPAEPQLAAVLPTVASTTGAGGGTGGRAAHTQRSVAPQGRSGLPESNVPSVISLASAGEAGETGGAGAMMEVWVDLPAVSDARFVQGIITGEIAPRIVASKLPSREAYNLVTACLQYNFKERPSAMELINHPFFFT